MSKKELLFPFDPVDPQFLTEGTWRAPVVLSGLRRIFVLIRVSTGKESQDTSIVHQLEHARNFSYQTDSQVVQIVVVRNSGLSMHKNKTFNKMMLEALNGGCDLLYLHSLSRLSRRSAYLDQHVTKLVRNKVPVYAYLEQFDTNKRGWKKELLNWGFIYEHESLSLSDRQKGCKRALELRKQYLGAEAPYGFVKDGKKLRPANDGSAEVVKDMFAMLLSGKSPCEIARILTQRGIPSPSDKLGRPNTSGKWYDTTVRKMLRNPVYSGDIKGRCSEVEVPGEITRTIIPQSERVLHKAVIEGIVEDDTFDAVQTVLDERARGKKGAVTDFIEPGKDFLADKLHCSDCGKPMTRIARSWGQTYYACSMHVRKGGKCTGRHSVPQSTLESVIRAEVKNAAYANAVLDGVKAELAAKAEQKRTRSMKEIQILNKKIERLQQRKTQVMANYYDRSLFDATPVEGESLKSDLEALLARTKAEIQEMERQKHALEQTLFATDHDTECAYRCVIETQLDELIRFLIRRIDIDVDGNIARIVYNLCPIDDGQNILAA